ncbi:hypothetical protein D049_4364A, partial [Vibrio parahaemolyticus VPTS-2010]
MPFSTSAKPSLS